MKQTREMPVNTVDQIEGLPPDEFDEVRQQEPSTGNLLSNLASLLGIPVSKIANALGGLTATHNPKLNAHCKCGKRYRYFPNEGYTEDQSVCPACRDKAMHAEREAAMRPEKLEAAKRLREQAAEIAEKKDQERRETVELVAQTVAHVLAKDKASA